MIHGGPTAEPAPRPPTVGDRRYGPAMDIQLVKVEIETLRLVWLLQNHRFDVADDNCRCGEFIEYLGGNDVDGRRWGLWAEHIVEAAMNVGVER